MLLSGAAAAGPGPIAIDYPLDGTVFPSEFPPPILLWRDPAPSTSWTVEIHAPGMAAPIRVVTKGERRKLGEVDPRAVATQIGPPKLTPQEAATYTWTPDPRSWESIKKASTAGSATITIRGKGSRGQTTIRTSTDPVGAPIFYRDVPLMPSETEKGVIKPLAPSAIPLIAWRVRDVAKPASRVVMQGIHSCANCHSFSADGKWMAMDVDGPLNDKGLYAIAPVQANSEIRGEHIVEWSTFRGKLGSKIRVGFMSQISPDGRYVVTTINHAAAEQSDYLRRKRPLDLISSYFVANFKDHRFLQVFYPTRGILAWYDRANGRLEPLPGADDPRFVHTSAVWSPDGKWLVFSRAAARDPFTLGQRLAEYANDPNEAQVRFDLYRIPFNGGRGGRAEPVGGASNNGMSNSFPKVSPDGKWIVYVQARNGQLMRPDSRLYIVPAAGGTARLMRCNTALMNSWHSFSPDGRWMVFSSKSRSPYTQMYLTHLDQNGNDSPPVMIENATAANRAVNIPEFVNIGPDGLLKIDAPVTGSFRAVDTASELAKKGQYEAAVSEWKKALELGRPTAQIYYNLGNALAKSGRDDEAMEQYQKALELSPDHAEALNNLGLAVQRRGRLPDAIELYQRALAADPEHSTAYSNLGAALAQSGRAAESLPYLERAIKLKPEDVDAHNNLGLALAMAGRYSEAVIPLREAVRLSSGREPLILDLLAKIYAETGRFVDAAATARRALAIAVQRNQRRLAEDLKVSIAGYEARIQGSNR